MLSSTELLGDCTLLDPNDILGHSFFHSDSPNDAQILTHCNLVFSQDMLSSYLKSFTPAFCADAAEPEI